MIVVDTSAWIEFFNATGSWQALRLQRALESEIVVVGDLVLCEVLRGFRDDRMARRAEAALRRCELRPMVGLEVALTASRHYRTLRARGRTVRKTIDLLIGTFCLLNELPLLHADRDFDVMGRELGLEVVAPG